VIRTPSLVLRHFVPEDAADLIVAVTAPDNAPSRRTLERAGFAHGADEVMVFQGVSQPVSRYTWRG
jgi:RimJ/RimL family protein N-acetyltransferase